MKTKRETLEAMRWSEVMDADGLHFCRIPTTTPFFSVRKFGKNGELIGLKSLNLEQAVNLWEGKKESNV